MEQREHNIQILTTEEEYQKHFKSVGRTLRMEDVTNEQVVKLFGRLPNFMEDKYSEPIPFLYKGEYMQIYTLYEVFRFGGGTLELAEELHQLLIQ